MILFKTFRENMKIDNQYLFYAVSNLLEFTPESGTVTTAILEEYEEALPNFIWEELDRKFGDPDGNEFPFDNDAKREKQFTTRSTQKTRTAAARLVRWAFKLGYLEEAMICCQALESVEFWPTEQRQ